MLPVRDIVVFPYMVLPLFVGRDMSIKAIEAALAGNRMIFLATQKSLDVENPQPEDIHPSAPSASSCGCSSCPTSASRFWCRVSPRRRIKNTSRTIPTIPSGSRNSSTAKQPGSSLESEAVMRTVKEQIERIVSLGKVLIPDVMVVIENLEDPGRLADMVASNLGLKVDITQAVSRSLTPLNG